ncbi:MAG TPA: hypothetical protein VIL72_07105 [Beijerinckiaceae bacterium]|jgi:hypothetical protein
MGRRSVAGTSFASAALPQRVRPAGIWRRSATASAALTLLLAAPCALIGARAHVVSAAPSTARLYAALGLDVNLRGVEISGLRTTMHEEAGARLLVVEGRLKNVSGASVSVPDLELSVRDAEGRRLYAWSAASPRPVLDRSDEITFRTRLISPPDGAADVHVTFR